MNVKLNCGHVVYIEFRGACPKSCKGTFQCPTCKSIECNCEPPKGRRKKRVDESKAPVKEKNVFLWNGKLSNKRIFKERGTLMEYCTPQFKKQYGYRYDEICVYCGRSYYRHNDYGKHRVCRVTEPEEVK